MFSFTDDCLNKIPMHRFTVYVLAFILSGALLLGSYGVIGINPFALLFSIAFFLFVCDIFNKMFASVYETVPNMDSLYITALILACIISPPASWYDANYYVLAFWASVWAIASKYVLSIQKRHVLNPAAFAVALTSIIFGLSATWWIGMPQMLPFTALGGVLLVRKIRRGNIVLSFFLSTAIFIFVPVAFSGGNVFLGVWDGLIHSAVVFFACIMLTEPLSAPPTPRLRIAYGFVVGLLFAPWVHVGSLYGTPELALLIANVVFFFISQKGKLFWIPKKVPVAVMTENIPVVPSQNI